MTGDHERLRHSLGAYVLGGLEPAERDVVERHLEECPACRVEVGELAPLPGLLRRLPEAEPPLTPPVELAERLVAAAAAERRGQRRRLRLWQAAAAVAALAAGSVVAGFTLAGDDADLTPMRAVVDGTDAEAAATVHARSWGTALEVEADGLRTGVTYILVAVADDGRTEQAGAWGYADGTRTRCSGSTSIPREQLAAVEIRTVTGRSLLRLDT